MHFYLRAHFKTADDAVHYNDERNKNRTVFMWLEVVCLKKQTRLEL